MDRPAGRLLEVARWMWYSLGERIGMIRFGSRMDVWLPDGVEILVRPGQHVVGGVSVLARWR